MQENAFENVVWKTAAILSRSQCVKGANTVKSCYGWSGDDYGDAFCWKLQLCILVIRQNITFYRHLHDVGNYMLIHNLVETKWLSSFSANFIKFILLNGNICLCFDSNLLKIVPKGQSDHGSTLVCVRIGTEQATRNYLNQWWFSLLTHTNMCHSASMSFKNANIFDCIWEATAWMGVAIYALYRMNIQDCDRLDHQLIAIKQTYFFSPVICDYGYH